MCAVPTRESAVLLKTNVSQEVSVPLYVKLKFDGADVGVGERNNFVEAMNLVN